jgi:hypothetical protein
MKNFSPRRAVLCALLLFALVAANSLQQPAHAQRREHLTEQEVEMVRDTQELDRRAELFIKIAERRLLVVTGAPAPSAKDLEKWGAVPKGSRAAHFNDLARIFDEAINNVDDVAARTPDSALIPKAVRKLEAAATRFLPQLTALRQSAGSADGERESLEQAIDNLQQIIEAAKRLPEEEEPTGKKGEKKKN